ncbi:MAG: exodeoxyribonuclease V subunit alpha [Limnohabitans sp.]|uniref:exodeoxyribonuclease V subunit alpha n=1 Tax=Limnohabitans sp. TaxID=1907725 RepID=UPI0025D63AFF|nr:exodeoxyribonuclease V subunit alpha [Limnohabitans sp.]MCO4088143.1 exodeoxyribonuclease V subunit alpha [Limnohabitans sp.]
MNLKKTSRMTNVPAAQMDWLMDLPAQGLTAAQTVQWLNLWTGQGLLRHIDSAFAAQVLRLDAGAAAPLLVAAAVLAHMEGRGHTCLAVAKLCQPPVALLGWPAAAVDGAQGLKALWAHLPATLADWQAALQGHSPSVGVRLADAPDQGQPLVLGGPADAPLLYLRRYAGYEQRVGQSLLQRASAPLAVPEAAAGEWLDRFFVPNPQAPNPQAHNFTDWQKVACAVALRARLSVITGGPGTGKTYTAARLLALLLALHPNGPPLRVALAAPTGKAAARLKQSIDDALTRLTVPADAGLDLSALIARMGPARTLHSLLGARPDTRQFRHHAANRLDVDVLIVDEASMVHLEMMDALLLALPPTARLVLLGDKDQLASVEAGAVLGDLCQDAAAGRYSAATAEYVQHAAGQTLAAEFVLPDPAPVLAQQTVMLRQSRRFKGAIGQLALAVNRGDAVAARDVFVGAASGRDGLVGGLSRSETAPTGQPSALLALQPSSPQAVCALALGEAGKPSYADYLRLLQNGPAEQGAEVSSEIHAQWARSVLQAFERFRILCAVHQGEWGTLALNAAVQKALADTGLLQVKGEWYEGRPVMVTRNDAQLGVFNGDVGVVLPGTEGKPKVWFLDGEALRSVSVMRMAQVDTAFVMTVHKSQGSEFEHTALVLPPGGAEVLSRELVYTGITRARDQFTLVEAEAGLLEAAIHRPSVRASGLAQRWAQPLVKPGAWNTQLA